MADFYDDMRTTATELLTEFSQGSMVLVRRSGGSFGVAPSETEYPMKGVARSVETRYFSDSVSSNDTQLVVAEFGQVPTLSDTVKINGVERQIIGVMKITEEPTALAWRIFVKG